MMEKMEDSAPNSDPGTVELLNVATPGSFDRPLAGADQACKECRRRKAKCDRIIPICGLCAKFGRQCRYEKHYRTPLTRKHLTEVEQRLEKAEKLLRQARLSSLVSTRPGSKLEDLDSPTSLPSGNLLATSGFTEVAAGTQELDTGIDEAFLVPSLETFPGHGSFNQHLSYSSGGAPPAEPGAQIEISILRDGQHPSNSLDRPPAVLDDFEWNEQHVPTENDPDVGWMPQDSSTGEWEEVGHAVVDGMASLTIGESKSGYLGFASGAALLRVIDPDVVDDTAQRRNVSRLRRARTPSASEKSLEPLYAQPDPNRHIVDTMIDAYFRLYNVSYPIVHEPTFRAQYSELIERPNGNCWNFLAYFVAAIGVFTTATIADTTDLELFAKAKSLMHLSYLESGNLTLIQALALKSNYLQKRNMPNSGYNYLGLATRMAMGIGLHKEFQVWNQQPLKMETRRRVWWCLCAFDVGATITFGRPVSWPVGGIDVALPSNVHDRELTAASKQIPPPSPEITLYTAIRALASFYLAVMPVYSRVISKPFPSADELISLDDRSIGGWYSSLPPFFTEGCQVPTKYRTSHAILMWKYRNFRIIMYRPFVIRQVLHARQSHWDSSRNESLAYNRCLHEARSTIESINDFWSYGEHTRMGSWYALYFLFQATLIPCLCLRNEPNSPNADEWQRQIQIALQVMNMISPLNRIAERCRGVIWGLCGRYSGGDVPPSAAPDRTVGPVSESPQTQMKTLYSMMWSNVSPLDADMAMQDDSWMDFFTGVNPLRSHEWNSGS